MVEAAYVVWYLVFLALQAQHQPTDCVGCG